MDISRATLAGLVLNFALLDELIEKFSLHSFYPVDLSPLFEALNIKIYYNLKLPAETKAFSVLRKNSGNGFSCFDRRLKGSELAYVKGHEMGHLLSHKIGRMHGCVSDGGVVRREELEADLVGAYLLVPGRPFLEFCRADFSLGQIAEIFGVTVEMLELRSQLMVARNEFDLG